MEIELECGGCSTRPAAAGAYCLSRSSESSSYEGCANACEVLGANLLKPSDAQFAALVWSAISDRFMLQGVEAHLLSSISLRIFRSCDKAPP
ncbi:MAG: hypothetical protein WCA28_20780 [Bradyrhizobium sp.]